MHRASSWCWLAREYQILKRQTEDWDCCQLILWSFYCQKKYLSILFKLNNYVIIVGHKCHNIWHATEDILSDFAYYPFYSYMVNFGQNINSIWQNRKFPFNFRVATLNFSRAKFKLLLFRKLFNRVSQEYAYEVSGVHKCWSVFKNPFRSSQFHCVISQTSRAQDQLDRPGKSSWTSRE